MSVTRLLTARTGPDASPKAPEFAARSITRFDLLGALGVLLAAGVVYSRFNIYGRMIRDSAIYIYGGQQVLHGLPPYASEMDPKGPLSSILASAGVAVAKLFGRSDILVVRAEFCAIAVLGVLGIYLLVLELCRSVVAALVAAAVFLSFRNLPYHALVQTDGHIPGIVAFIYALWLTVRRRWYLAGFAASLAFLTWQPLFSVPIICFVCAVVWSPGRRLRAAARWVAGFLSPVLALVVYYSFGGHLWIFLQGLVIYPLTGVQRPPMSIGHTIKEFVVQMPNLYGSAVILFWVGIAILLVAALWTVLSAGSRWRSALADPLVLLFTVSLAFQFAYVAYDYIGYPHTWPVLPYAAVGCGVGAAKLLAALSGDWSRAAGAVLVAAAAVLAVVAGFVYSRPLPRDGQLHRQLAAACALQRSLAPGTPLWVVDDPIPLVLLHRRQPDNFPYVGGGLDIWKVNHTRGGFAGWTRQIVDSKASIVIVDNWVDGRYKQPIQTWLMTHGYRRGYIGPWKVFVTEDARAQMAVQSIALTRAPTGFAQRVTGGRITSTRCIVAN